MLNILFRSAAEPWMVWATGATGADQPMQLSKISKVDVRAGCAQVVCPVSG